MKKLFICVLLGFLLPNMHLLAVKPATAPVKPEVSKKEQRQLEKQQKKQAKWEKRIKKIEKKLAKKGYAAGGSVWDDDNFKLGALIALGGLVVRLFAFLPFIGGIFSLIGTLILLLGLGIMIWVLIDG